jgi:Type IV secretion-system coupling protein DNA-binding domain
MASALFIFASGLAAVALVMLARWLDAVAWRRSLVAFRLSLPHDLPVEAVARWLALINAATYAHRLALLSAPPVALEVVGTSGGITHYLLVPRRQRSVVLSHLRSALPGVRVEAAPDYVSHRRVPAVAAEATLTNHRRPLRLELAEATNGAVLAALQPVHGTEAATIQYIVTGGGIPRVVRSINANQRQPAQWWLDGGVSIDSEAVRAERAKQQAPLLRVVIRVGVSSPDRRRRYSLFGRVWGTLRTMNGAGAGVVRRWWLPSRLAAGRMHRLALPVTPWPLTLNAGELAGLMGLATHDLYVPGLTTSTSRQLPATADLPRRGAVIAVSNYPGMTDRPLALSTADRLHHTYFLGPTGVGKSTALGNLIVQDVHAGFGVVVVDARGDLVTDVLSRIPDKLHGDVIVIDPSATDRPVGFNILAHHGDEPSRERAVDHVLYVLHDLYRSSWGPRTADVLRASLSTLVATRAPDGSRFTLCEVPELLTNRRLRTFVTDQLAPGPLLSFWHGYEGLSEANRAEVIGPVMNKLRALTLKASLRLLLGQSEGLHLAEVFRQRRIVLVPLSKGLLGSETAQLVGSLLIASLWQATLERVRLPPERRRPVWLYADEFQETVRLPLDLADMLAQARALGLGLTLAHQHLAQLPEVVKTAVLSTARTQAVFQLDHDDARSLEPRFAPLTARDLMGLARYEIALRPCVGGRTAGVVTGRTLPLPESVTDGAALAAASRERYGVARQEVEAALRRRLETGTRRQRFGRTDESGEGL